MRAGREPRSPGPGKAPRGPLGAPRRARGPPSARIRPRHARRGAAHGRARGAASSRASGCPIPTRSGMAESWRTRLARALSAAPGSRGEMIRMLRAAERKGLVNADALGMISKGRSRSRTSRCGTSWFRAPGWWSVDRDKRPEEFIDTVVESGHSRFPVIGDAATTWTGSCWRRTSSGTSPSSASGTSTFATRCAPPGSCRRASGSTCCSRSSRTAGTTWPSW